MTDDPVNDLIAKFIRQERLKRALRAKDMHRLTGIPLSSYACLETARYRISPENLLRIQVALRCPLEALWPFGKWRVERVDDEVIRFIVGETAKLLPTPPTLEDVFEAVFHVTGIEYGQIASRSLKRDISLARAIAAFLVAETPGLTLYGLAQEIGMHVATVSHTVSRARAKAERDADFKALVESARKWLKRVRRERD